MFLMGDEVGRTQQGNNNAYCQDNALSWTDWTLTPERQDLLAFTRRMIQVWKQHPVLRRRKFFQGRRIRGADVQDIAWLDPTGTEMTDAMWSSPDVRAIGVRLNGDAIQEVDERGRRIAGDTLLLLRTPANAGVVHAAGPRRSSGGTPFAPPIRGSRRAACAAAIATNCRATRWRRSSSTTAVTISVAPGTGDRREWSEI